MSRKLLIISYRWVYNIPKACKNKQNFKQKPFKFKNSLGNYFDKLFDENKLQFIGNFNSPSNKLYVCNEWNHDPSIEIRDKYLCVPIKSYPGKWNVYFIDSLNHWNYRLADRWDEYTSQPERYWEGAALILHESANFDVLDELVWHKDVAYAYNVIGVYSYDQYGLKSSLDPKMIARVDKCKKWTNINDGFLNYIHDSYDLNEFRDKYIFLPYGVTFQTPEDRARPYIYGLDKTNTAIAIFLHTLY